MDKYDILKKQIDSYELLPDVISDEEVISAYDLYQILKEELEPLEELFEDADKFKEQINQDNTYIKRVGLCRKVPTIDYICDYVSEKGLLLLKKVSLEIDCLNKLSQKIIGKNKIGKSYTKKLINK